MIISFNKVCCKAVETDSGFVTAIANVSMNMSHESEGTDLSDVTYV
jgi:hypothetical protein